MKSHEKLYGGHFRGMIMDELRNVLRGQVSDSVRSHIYCETTYKIERWLEVQLLYELMGRVVEK